MPVWRGRRPRGGGKRSRVVLRCEKDLAVGWRWYNTLAGMGRGGGRGGEGKVDVRCGKELAIVRRACRKDMETRAEEGTYVAAATGMRSEAGWRGVYAGVGREGPQGGRASSDRAEAPVPDKVSSTSRAHGPLLLFCPSLGFRVHY